MGRVLIRFYAELNDFLPSVRRQQTFEHTFSGAPAPSGFPARPAGIGGSSVPHVLIMIA